MLEILLAIVVFLLVISLLVAAHEYGHYVFARLFNMGVEEFAIGFGRPVLTTWMRRSYTIPLEPGQEAWQPPADEERAVTTAGTGQKLAIALEGGLEKHAPPTVIDTPQGKALRETTVFTVRSWPFGGFVRIKGMMPEEDGSETRVAGGFYSKPAWQRFVVLFAGPVFSIVAGVVVLGLTYAAWGIEKPVKEPILGAVGEETPAAVAGLKPDDRIVAIDGKPIATFADMMAAVRASEGKELAFAFERAGEQRTTTVIPQRETAATPVINEDLELTARFERQVKIGIGPKVAKQRVDLQEAMLVAMGKPGEMLSHLGGLLRQPKHLDKAVGGPATIFAFTKQAAISGVEYVLGLGAMLSISIGILNLLPVPPLDGGQMMIALAEMLRGGRRLSIRVQTVVTATGFAMVMTLIAAVLFIDARRFLGPKPERSLVAPAKAPAKAKEPPLEK